MPRRTVVVESPLSTEELQKIAKGNTYTVEEYKDFVEDVKDVIRTGEQNMWRKADLAQEAAQRYGKLRELCDELGQSYGYWRILSHVSRQYSKEDRDRFPTLSFGHFQIVVSHKNRMELLERAAAEGWSIHQMAVGKYGEKEEEEKPIKEPRNPATPEQLETKRDMEAQKIIRLESKEPQGRVIKEAAALLNFLYFMDKNVGSSVGTSVRECEPKLSKWIAEQLEVPEHGVGVLDIFNLLFIDHGVIEYLVEKDEPFIVRPRPENTQMDAFVEDDENEDEE